MSGPKGKSDRARTTAKKTTCGNCGRSQSGFYDRVRRPIRDLSCGDRRIYLEVEMRRVQCRRCGKVKRERLDWISDNPCYTKRFAFFVGRRCREMSLQAVARELRLDWHTVKALDQQYMEEQLRRAPQARPRVVGIDEVSVGQGHQYRIVVSDLEKRRAIWFGGTDRSEESLDQFYQWLGPDRRPAVSLAVMDMWKAFALSTQKQAPAAAILYDKFHVLRHLSRALDRVRKQEYARLAGQDRSYIKGQKYTLLSKREHLSLDGRRALKKLLAANRRLYTAYVLKESFDQLWEYRSEVWARRFFDHWKAALQWQRLKPYAEFAELIERHWNGIALYCCSENRFALGFVEGLNNKIRVLQRRAYGLRDEDYLRLKILTASLNPI